MGKVSCLAEIDSIFADPKISRDKIKKAIRLANKNRIRLGKHREKFCKKCFGPLNNCKIRLSRSYKTILCGSCGYFNKTKIS